MLQEDQLIRSVVVWQKNSQTQAVPLNFYTVLWN